LHIILFIFSLNNIPWLRFRFIIWYRRSAWMTHGRQKHAVNLNWSRRPPCVNHQTSVRGPRVMRSSVYRPMSVGRATTPVAWISRRRPSASISTSVIFGGPNHQPVGNKRPARSRRLVPPRLVFVLDLVSRLMDRGCAPVRSLFRSSSPSFFLFLPLRDFLLSRWSPRRGDKSNHWFLILKICGFHWIRESFFREFQ